MENKKRAITLIGMSGVGKTYFSEILEGWGWARYSCDGEIGKDLLGLTDEMKSSDIGALHKFLGMPGDEAKGGLPIREFKRRQNLYKNAEIVSLMELRQRIEAAGERNFVNDSTGSLVEITNPDVIEFVGQLTKVVYIRGSGDQKQVLLDRAQSDPKPLYYPPGKFDEWVAEYCATEGLSGPEAMDPQGFSIWVFPKLLESRIPKYQQVADRFGVTIESVDLEKVSSEAEFFELIGE